MYIDHNHLCVSVRQCLCLSMCLSVPRRIPALLHPDVTWGMVGVHSIDVHYWADLQSVHGFRCYDNIAANAKCQRVLVLALCLVVFSTSMNSGVGEWESSLKKQGSAPTKLFAIVYTEYHIIPYTA